MRIISGTHRGTYIPVPKHFEARPTTDFAKEALFNILANSFDFEGTGSIGYEFASRGATQVDMIEINSRYADFIQSKVSAMKFENIHVFQKDVFRILPELISKYDLIFADPPYLLEDLDKIPDEVLRADILESDGWFILEHGHKHSFNSHEKFKEIRRYGSVHFSIFSNK